ncbi:MAG: AAA family ATPase [Theionarchaea archaeon]|nr:AAA family ATPase [Theionarchaea archaeon]
MLCVVGMPGCGKSIFLNAAQKSNHTIISMGDAVRAETKKRGLPPESHGGVAEALRKEKGLSAVAYLILDRITMNSIVDGVRGLEEIEVFSEHYAVDILAIHASPRTRFRRLKKRKRPGDPETWKEFTERDIRELTFGIGNVIALADYILLNESTKAAFEARCSAFLKKRGMK